eukprot:1016623_1
MMSQDSQHNTQSRTNPFHLPRINEHPDGYMSTLIPSPTNMKLIMKESDEYWNDTIEDHIQDDATMTWDKIQPLLFPNDLYDFKAPPTHHKDWYTAWTHFEDDIRNLFNHHIKKTQPLHTLAIRRRIPTETTIQKPLLKTQCRFSMMTPNVGYGTASRNSTTSNMSTLLDTPLPNTPYTPDTPAVTTPVVVNAPVPQSNRWNFTIDTKHASTQQTLHTPPPPIPIQPSPFPMQSQTSVCGSDTDAPESQTLSPDIIIKSDSEDLPSFKHDDSDHSKKSRWQIECSNDACCKTSLYQCSLSTGIYGAYTIGYDEPKVASVCCTNRLTQLLAFCEPLKRILLVLDAINICNDYNHEQLLNDFWHIHEMHGDLMTSCDNIADYFHEREMSESESAEQKTDVNDDFEDQRHKIRSYLKHLNGPDDMLRLRRYSSASITPPFKPLQKLSPTISVEDMSEAKESPTHHNIEPMEQNDYSYVGVAEDMAWWKDLKPKDDTQSDDHIHRILVQRMGVFRWQNSHGFMAGKDSQEAIHYHPRFENIKQEVLHNSYNRLAIDSWNQTLRKTDTFFKSFARKKIITPQSGYYEDLICRQTAKWESSQGISKKEIIIMKLYTDYDTLQGALKKCFRFETYKDILKWSDTELYDQAKQALKKRLQEFWHWRGGLLVTVTKFGTKVANKTLYHGVNAKMIIKASQTFAFNGPLSTTSSFHVARTFATAKGMILTIGTQYPRLNYCNAFDVTLISEYPDEHEWLVGFMYVRLLQLSTRETRLMDPTDIHELAGMCKKVSLSSWTKQMFFVVHLFNEQIFSMTEDLERMLGIFLAVNRTDCCQKPRIKENYLCRTLCDIAHNKHEEEMKMDDDEWKMKRIMVMLWNKFEYFCQNPTYKQHVRFDSISKGLKPFFMDETERKCIDTGEALWAISFDKITAVYPNIKEIHFMNEYKLDDAVLRKLIEQIGRTDRTNTIQKISFLYYNYKDEHDGKPSNHRMFYDPDLLDKQLVNKLANMGWLRKHRKNGQTGYKIRIYKKTN